MKYFAYTLLAILVIAVLAGIGRISQLVWTEYRRVQPETYASVLNTDRSRYSAINSIEAKELYSHAYDYERNVYVDALQDKSILPKVADKDGRIPAFQLDDDLFFITDKWLNWSSGLAISNDANFIDKIQDIEACMYVKKLQGNMYRWSLDLENPRLP